MILRAALLALLLAPAPAGATVAEEAATASAALEEAMAALAAADGAKDRVAALTQTIRAQEAGLAALREALRQARLRESALILKFDAKRAEVSQLLGVLSQLEAQPEPLLLLHPDGPLGTARSGMMLAEVTPALQAEATALGRELAELRDLRDLQTGAAGTLQASLAAAQDARSALSQAISDRTTLPRRYLDDPEALTALKAASETLDAFALGLAPDPALVASDFPSARGSLPMPVLGRVILRAGEADARGVRRPGISIAARPGALVTAPWPATIRYIGPLLDYGNVMVLEPGAGYLLVLAGLGTLYGRVGDVVPQGAALGLMGGDAPGVAEFLAPSDEGAGARESETLYMELRRGTEPEDPGAWFADVKE